MKSMLSKLSYELRKQTDRSIIVAILVPLLTISWLLILTTPDLDAEEIETRPSEATYLNDRLPVSVNDYVISQTYDFFSNEELFDYLDGGAVDYIENGFASLFVQRYQNDTSIIVLEIFRFDHPEGLQTIWASEGAGRPLDMGEEGFIQNQYAAFHENTLLVKCYSSSAVAEQAVVAIASQAEDAVKSYHLLSRRPNDRMHNPSKKFIGSNGRPLVVIGASYAKGWKVRDFKGVRIINKGASGEKTSEMLTRFQQDVIDVQPSAVIIWGHINDIFRSPKKDIDATIVKTKSNLQQMITLADDSGILPIIATETTVRPPSGMKEAIMGTLGRLRGKQSYQDYVNQKVQSVNRWVKGYAAKEGIILLDLESILADESGSGMRKKTYATADGSHISAEGYEKLTEYILGQLDPYLE
jgi:lysophospholipase L1-like esterase